MNNQTILSPATYLGDYRELLQGFLDEGYAFRFFGEQEKQEGEVILRHDIDFDTHMALKTAQIETDLGIQATYFFLLRSNFYNIFSARDFDQVLAIRELGHKISIHFDPLIYQDFHQGLSQEIEIFERLFKEKVDIISLHRPNEFFQTYDAPIHGVEHTYQSKYFKEIKYISDSTGVFRFGHPFDSEEFAQGKSIHLLIHPVWWVMQGVSNLDKLRKYYEQRKEDLKMDFYNNCIPFRQIYEKIR